MINIVTCQGFMENNILTAPFVLSCYFSSIVSLVKSWW